MMYISVILPVYNVEKYLVECLDSLLTLDFNEMEVICINDGSTDRSLEVLKTRAASDNRVVILNYGENHGQAYARNYGIKHARGKYVAFVDADDMSIFRNVIKFADIMDNEGLDGILFNAETIYEREEYKKFYYPPTQRRFDYKGIFSGPELYAMLINNNEFSNNVWQQLWRREYLQENNIFFHDDTFPYEDILFTFKAILKANRICCLKEEGYIYRLRYNSSSTAGLTWQRVQARGIGLAECFLVLNQMELPEDTVSAAAKHLGNELKYLLDECRRMNLSPTNIDSMKINNPLYRTIYWLVILNKYKYIKDKISNSFIERLKKWPGEIIVYGAGEVGHEVVDFLESCDLTNFLVMVTERKDDLWLGQHKVQTIDELEKYNHSGYLLVAVTQKHQAGMIEALRKHGFHHYELMV